MMPMLDNCGGASRIPPHQAGIAQLVEHNLAKVGVASSNLVSRSRISITPRPGGVFRFDSMEAVTLNG